MRYNTVKRGDVFMANLDPVIGSEQGGCRPVIILQNDVGNKYSPTTIVSAVTSRKKKLIPTHVNVGDSCISYHEYSSAAEPPVRSGESHHSGLTEPPIMSNYCV